MPVGSPDPAASAGRLFVGVPLAPGLRRALEAHLRAATSGRPLPGRLVEPRSWHFTLRFLGETPPEAAHRLREELRSVPPRRSFRLRLGTAGAFPRPRRASVLWMGVGEGSEELRGLAGDVEAAAVRAGFAAEERPFRAHLTLSRLRQPADATGVLEGIPPFGGAMEVDRFVLFRSHLGAGPPRYETVEEWTLEP